MRGFALQVFRLRKYLWGWTMIKSIRDIWKVLRAHREVKAHIEKHCDTLLIHEAVFEWFSIMIEDCIIAHTNKSESAPRVILLRYPITLTNGRKVTSMSTSIGMLTVDVDANSDAIIKVIA